MSTSVILIEFFQALNLYDLYAFVINCNLSICISFNINH